MHSYAQGNVAGAYLSATEERKFWISVDFDRLGFGRGPTIGALEIMSFTIDESDALAIEHIGFATGHGNSGDSVWRICDTTGFAYGKHSVCYTCVKREVLAKIDPFLFTKKSMFLKERIIA